MEKKLIQDPDTPIRSYNYSYIRDRIVNDYHQKVSLPTIISRSNDMGYCRKKKAHNREVVTNYAGELISHDSSHHKFSPCSKSKWFLITSLDDYSRFILYARGLVKRESTWAHIKALEAVRLRYGVAATYYVDSHSIFRFEARDSFWRKHYSLTDEVDPRWKQVADELGGNI